MVPRRLSASPRMFRGRHRHHVRSPHLQSGPHARPRHAMPSLRGLFLFDTMLLAGADLALTAQWDRRMPLAVETLPSCKAPGPESTAALADLRA